MKSELPTAGLQQGNNDLNIYDKKSIHCYNCNRFIGEIDYDAVITMPKCGRCANPLPEDDDDKVLCIVNKFNKNLQDLTKPLDSVAS
jgi:hypothetical protein